MNRQATLKLAKAYGCEIDVATNGRIYLYAPEGKTFRSCQSQAVGIGGSNLPSKPTKEDWMAAFHFFKSEIAEGFES